MAWVINDIPWFKMDVISYSYRNKTFETHGENWNSRKCLIIIQDGKYIEEIMKYTLHGMIARWNGIILKAGNTCKYFTGHPK